MVKTKFIFPMLITSWMLMGCNSSKQEQAATPASEPAAVVQEDTVSAEADRAALMEQIDRKREAIEALTVQPVEVSTASLREKVKQKWSKIHFYLQNNQVVRIKTYPYAQISKRTEEFYADSLGLMLVVTADRGGAEKNEPKAELDKLYYYQNGQFIGEQKNSSEKEFNLKNSDAEELLTEFQEYLDIYQQTKK